jgi:16S rRNA (cytosine967-C5)-methyltransferase
VKRGARAGPATARRAAVEALERTLATLAPAELALERAERGLDERDRRLARELLFGALRFQRRLEWALERASGRAFAAVDAALRPVLLVAAVQLLLLDRVPAHAAVDEAAGEARRRRGAAAAGFVNAVLRKLAARPRLDDWPVDAADPVRRLALETSHPDRLVERWWRRFGAETTKALLAASHGDRSVHLLAFSDRGGREAAARALAAEGCATRPSALAPDGLVVVAGSPFDSAPFGRGDLYVQDEASQAAALVPPPRAGESVLDAAAAPGGKGLALLAREPSVLLVAADRSLRRMERLRANLRRLGRSFPLLAADAARPPWRARFERVVLDASCSGTGTLRRHPELKWRFREEELARLAGAALEQLLALAAAVAPGGRLVHVTCSIEPEENEAVVERFLRLRSEFALEPLNARELPGGAAALDGVGRWRVLPDGGHDGFSVAVLRRAR